MYYVSLKVTEVGGASLTPTLFAIKRTMHYVSIKFTQRITFQQDIDLGLTRTDV
jgi:hypothetical protein